MANVKIKAGKLRHQVIIQQLTEVDDGQGGFTESWDKLSTEYMSIQPTTGRFGFTEQFFAGQIKPGITHLGVMRFRADVTEKMRILFGAKVLDIKGLRDVDQIGRKLELTLEERR